MSAQTEKITNGAGAAALLAAGIGCFAMGVLSVAGDGSKSLAKALTFYVPTGPLSGVSTVAIIIWLAAWGLLAKLWNDKNVAVAKAYIVSLVLLAAGALLTFPPFGDLLLGK